MAGGPLALPVYMARGGTAGTDRAILVSGPAGVLGTIMIAGKTWGVYVGGGDVVVWDADDDWPCATPSIELTNRVAETSMLASSESGDDHIDLMVVWTPGAVADAAVFSGATGIAIDFDTLALLAAFTWQDALESSLIGTSVQLVASKQVAWNEPNTLQGVVNALNDSTPPAGNAGLVAIQALRESVDADVVLALVQTTGAGGLAPPANDPDASYAEDRFAAAILWDSFLLDPKLASHELGHLLGLNHNRIERDSALNTVTSVGDPNFGRLAWEVNGGSSQAFGHIACTVESGATVARRSVMAYQDTDECNTSTWTAFNRYSDAGRFFPDTFMPSGTTSSVVVPPGSSWMPAGFDLPLNQSTLLARDANDALRARETWPTVANYRTSTIDPGGVYLISPLPGSNVSSASVTFQWNSAATVRIWIDSVALGSPIVAGPFTGTQSTTITGVPTTDPLAVRIWTLVNATNGTWAWRDYRLNVAAKVIGCDKEPQGLPIWPELGATTCSPGGVPVCTLNTLTDTVTCDMSHGTGTATPT